jgi:hypothetical protein
MPILGSMGAGSMRGFGFTKIPSGGGPTVYSFSSGTRLPLLGVNGATSFPAAGWTSLQNSSVDDAFVTVPLPFTFYIANTGYTSTFVGSNSYITFGSGSNNYSSLSASNPNVPKLMFGAADNSYQRVSYISFSTNYTRIRYEGSAATFGTVGSPSIVVEITLFNPTNVLSGSNMIEMLVGTHGRTTGVSLIANASSQYAPITLTANNSYVLIGNASGTAWTTYSGYKADVSY